jgi:hypothetical protein
MLRPGSFAKFAAILLASSLVSNFAADLRSSSKSLLLSGAELIKL